MSRVQIKFTQLCQLIKSIIDYCRKSMSIWKIQIRWKDFLQSIQLIIDGPAFRAWLAKYNTPDWIKTLFHQFCEFSIEKHWIWSIRSINSLSWFLHCILFHFISLNNFSNEAIFVWIFENFENVPN